MVLDHRLALDLEGVAVGTAEQVNELQPLGLLDGLRRRAGRDQAEQRQARPFALVADQLDGPRREALALDQALLLQRLEVTHDAVGRLDVKGLPDLPDRGAVAAALNFVPDKVVNLPLTLGQLTEIRHSSTPCTWNKPRLRNLRGTG